MAANEILGAVFAIEVDGNPVATGELSEDTPNVESGRTPITIVVKVPLTGRDEQGFGVWISVRDTEIDTDNFASLSAILTYD